MGTIQHDALIIGLHPRVPWAALDEDYDAHMEQERAAMNSLRERICEILDEGEEKQSNLCSPIIHSRTNGYSWLFIAPDGSKEGWSTSDDMDAKREKIRRTLPPQDVTILHATFGELNVALIPVWARGEA
jgi:hypothetical protein